jgi:hypothetical protein
MMASKVFISYRRDDSAGHAGRVHDRLEREFGRDLLFMDVDAVPLGVNFVKVLSEEVAKCDVLLAVIGPNWLNARDEDGNRRLDNPHDFVRIEIGAALQRNIPVIPILLDGAKVPKPSQLPKELEELSLRNGLDVRHVSFHNDIDKLVRSLQGQLAEADARRRDEDERRRQAEIKQRADEEERQRKAEAEKRRRDEEERRRQEKLQEEARQRAEEEEARRRDEEERRRHEAENKRRLDEAEAEKRLRDAERRKQEKEATLAAKDEQGRKRPDQEAQHARWAGVAAPGRRRIVVGGVLTTLLLLVGWIGLYQMGVLPDERGADTVKAATEAQRKAEQERQAGADEERNARAAADAEARRKAAEADQKRLGVASIMSLFTTPIVLVASKNLPLNTLKEFIDYAKANPGKLSYATGVGSAGEPGCVQLLDCLVGNTVVHVPYRGIGPALKDFAAGQIPLLCADVSTVKQRIDSGAVKAITILSKERSKELPNVPTALESLDGRTGL